MPAKGTSKLTSEQKAKIAAGKIAGMPSKEIARDAGVSVSTVDHVSRGPQVQTLIGKLKARDELILDRCWKLALEKLEARLKSKNFAVVRDATRDLVRIAEAGDPPLARLENLDGTPGEFTLEELLVCYRKRVIGGE